MGVEKISRIFNLKTIKGKMVTSFVLVSLFLTILFSAQSVMSQNALIESKLDDTVFTTRKIIETRMDSILDEAELALMGVSENKEVQRLFAEGDREGLKDLLLPVWEKVYALGVAQFQFHTPDSHSFLRLHKPEKYGDDLSSFRHTVNEANRQKKIIRGLEEGRAGYGFRVVVPISYNGTHIGTVEYGINFGDQFLQDLKNDFGGDYFIYPFTDQSSVAWDQNSGKSFLAGTLESDSINVDDGDLERVENGETVSFQSPDGNYEVILVPFQDYSGVTKGYIKSIVSLSEVNALKTGSFIMLLIIGVAGFSVAVILAFLVVRNLIKPIKRISSEVKKLAETGDLSIRSSVKTSDEIGEMATALNVMLDNIATPVKELTNRAAKIAEGDLRTKVDIEAKGDITNLVNIFKKMADNLKGVLKEIKVIRDTPCGSASCVSKKLVNYPYIDREALTRKIYDEHHNEGNENYCLAEMDPNYPLMQEAGDLLKDAIFEACGFPTTKTVILDRIREAGEIEVKKLEEMVVGKAGDWKNPNKACDADRTFYLYLDELVKEGKIVRVDDRLRLA